MNSTNVVFADVNNEAGVRLLLYCHFASFFFRSNLYARLGDFDLLFIKVRCDLDQSVLSFLDLVDSFSYGVCVGIMITRSVFLVAIFVHFVDHDLDSLLLGVTVVVGAASLRVSSLRKARTLVLLASSFCHINFKHYKEIN